LDIICVMGDVVELREHRLREYLRGGLGRRRLTAILSSLGGGPISGFFRYSPRNDVVYIEPELLMQSMESDETRALTDLELMLEALQRAPAEVKELLDTDEEGGRPHGWS